MLLLILGFVAALWGGLMLFGYNREMHLNLRRRTFNNLQRRTAERLLLFGTVLFIGGLSAIVWSVHVL